LSLTLAPQGSWYWVLRSDFWHQSSEVQGLFILPLWEAAPFRLEFICGREHIGGTEAGLPQEQQGETSMTDLLLENFKLIVLVLLIGSIIGLSHLSGENLTKMKRAIHGRRRHETGSIAASL
jgi:hypothetical protein